MVAEGRRPSFDSAGNIRGWRSRPGAQQAPASQFGVPGISGPSSATPEKDWRDFFKKPPASTAPTTPPNVTPSPSRPMTSADFSGNGRISLAPESPADATAMVGSSRPFTTPRIDARDLIRQANTANDGWISTSRNEALAIGAKYGASPQPGRAIAGASPQQVLSAQAAAFAPPRITDAGVSKPRSAALPSYTPASRFLTAGAPPSVTSLNALADQGFSDLLPDEWDY